MPAVIAQRMTAKVEGDFVVFLIGMRINRLWKIHKWLPVAMAMPRMLRELSQNPTSGYLGAESWFGKPTILLQCWRSFEDLDSYAKKNQLRAPARMGRRSVAPWVAEETWASGMRHTASNRETSNAFTTTCRRSDYARL